MDRIVSPDRAATLALGLWWELTDTLVTKGVITKAERTDMISRLGLLLRDHTAKLRKDCAVVCGEWTASQEQPKP